LAIAQWGRIHGEDLAGSLGFRRTRTPCHASIHNVLAKLDVASFETVLTEWISQHLPPHKRKILAVDGKKLRGVHGKEVPGVFLISLFAQTLGLPVAQVGATDKEGELTGARALLETLNGSGVILSGDALYCQRDLCEQIAEKGGTIS
jgi:hypothetical protein